MQWVDTAIRNLSLACQWINTIGNIISVVHSTKHSFFWIEAQDMPRHAPHQLLILTEQVYIELKTIFTTWKVSTIIRLVSRAKSFSVSRSSKGWWMFSNFSWSLSWLSDPDEATCEYIEVMSMIFQFYKWWWLRGSVTFWGSSRIELCNGVALGIGLICGAIKFVCLEQTRQILFISLNNSLPLQLWFTD